MSTTRVLMLGAVRIFQPVHGYFVRRELLSWRADRWASLNPGSVYNALRSLAREGFLEEVEPSGGRPGRTSYRLTPDGETEFVLLVRDGLWQLHDDDPSRVLAAVSFWWALSREEVVAALENRVAQLDAAHRQLPFSLSSIRESPDMPGHIAEIAQLGDARFQGERAWAVDCLERIRAGAYSFAGEQWPGHGEGPSPT
jgi:DNA-binding PadR family transcriptional regulator